MNGRHCLNDDQRSCISDLFVIPAQPERARKVAPHVCLIVQVGIVRLGVH